MAKETLYQQYKTPILVIAAIVLTLVLTSPLNFVPTMTEESLSYDSYGGKGYDMVASRNSAPIPPMADYAPSPAQAPRIEKYASASYEVEPVAYDSTRTAVERLVDTYAGYYTYKDENKQNIGDTEYRIFTINLKVPVTSFDSAVATLKGLPGLKSLSASNNDVTLSYYDTKAYLDNYLVERGRLLKLYEKTASVEELIALEKALSELQIKIDQHTQTLKDIERRTDYSTISVTIQEKPEIIEAFYEMTSLRVLGRNVLASFDGVFILLSSLVGYVIIFGLLYLGYRGIRRLRR